MLETSARLLRLLSLLLDDEEAVAVAVGLRTAAGGAIAGIEDAALRALAKLEQVLPARLRSRVGCRRTISPDGCRSELRSPGGGTGRG